MKPNYSALRDITLCLAFLQVGCSQATPNVQFVQASLPRIESPVVSEANVAQLVTGNHTFAFDLYRLIPAGKMDNLIYSPHSISLCFSMVYAGAQGDTETEMVRVLHFLPKESQHPTLNAVDQRLKGLEKARSSEAEGIPFQLSLANSVWGQQGHTFKPAFLSTLAVQYGAGLHIVDFQASPESARQRHMRQAAWKPAPPLSRLPCDALLGHQQLGDIFNHWSASMFAFGLLTPCI